ncbi:polysaccharide biosynthesis tyrosine autokinase (plasmid) [Tundrisphaera sp. TA3]|uniref:exopolysaccharide transport family protein n=1 Tax=Tundrisphaera sp. TA3 TaxID=3435775 RepID=UPI003EBAD1A6
MRRYWWLVLGLWSVLSVGLAALIYLKVQPLYESESYLRVEEKNSLYVGNTNNDLSIFLETLVQLIKSSNVLQTAAVDPAVAVLPRIRQADDAVLELRKAINVRTIPGTYLISVSMASRDPGEAATIVNAVVDSFLKMNREWSDGLTQAQTERLETYLATLKAQSDELENRWKELAKKGDVDNQVFQQNLSTQKSDNGKGQAVAAPTSGSMMTIQEYKTVQREYLEVTRELATAESWRDHIRSTRGSAMAEGNEKENLDQQVVRMFHTDPEVIGTGDKLIALQEKINNVKKVSRDPNDPALRRHREAFENVKARYDQLWATKSPQFRDHILKRGTNPDDEIREADEKIHNLKFRKAALEEEMKKLQVASSKMATDEVEIALIREARQAIKDMQDTIHRKLDDLKFSAKDGSRIRLTNEATRAGRPQSDNRLKYLAMTPVGVLLAVLGLVIALELRSARVSDPDLLSSRVRHEVFSIAPLPNLSGNEDGRSARAEQKLARFVQSLDHLRVALCDGGIPGQGRVVLITSATGGEGKTTLSAHLAARCANAGTSLLLIDADMRHASLGRLLDVPTGLGLADVLNGDITIEEAMSTVQAGGFSFLSAGTPGIDPSRILTSFRFASLIDQLRGMFDLVLIDSPPILPVPDALLMGRHVDGVVMSSRFDASRLPMVERASRQLAMANIPVLGMVVNGAPASSTDYGKYHYDYQYPSRRAGAEGEADQFTA